MRGAAGIVVVSVCGGTGADRRQICRTRKVSWGLAGRCIEGWYGTSRTSRIGTSTDATWGPTATSASDLRTRPPTRPRTRRVAGAPAVRTGRSARSSAPSRAKVSAWPPARSWVRPAARGAGRTIVLLPVWHRISRGEVAIMTRWTGRHVRAVAGTSRRSLARPGGRWHVQAVAGTSGGDGARGRPTRKHRKQHQGARGVMVMAPVLSPGRGGTPECQYVANPSPFPSWPPQSAGTLNGRGCKRLAERDGPGGASR